MRQASVLQGSLSDRCDHPNIFIGPHESGVPVSFPMLSVLAETRSESAVCSSPDQENGSSGAVWV